MGTSSTRVSRQYRITLPKWIRKQLNIKRMDRLVIDVQDEMLILLPLHQGYTEALGGYYREIWKRSEEYTIQERSAWTDSKYLKGNL